MADHAVDDGDIFVYRGGQAPRHVIHVLIDRSLDEIEDRAFKDCRRLVQVDTHDGLRKIGMRAFLNCISLRRINLKSVVEIEENAFYNCENLADVEFGNRLETIGDSGFGWTSLTHLKLPSIITIGGCVFWMCEKITDIELSERLETIKRRAFCNCERLQRIAIPLKRNLFVFSENEERYTQFNGCEQLTIVDIVGGVHKTITSLHMESWRAEMLAEINRINQVLPYTHADDKTGEIQRWMEVVMDKMDHYKSEHCRYVREGITLLELALWKAKLLDENDEDSSVVGQKKKAKVDSESPRKEKRITCGADMVIKNVLPLLKLE